MIRIKNGLVHLYWGDGKGKTTAACGLALRALGSGLSVVIVQFLKSGKSSELAPLRALGAVVLAEKPSEKFVSQMDDSEKAQTRAMQTALLQKALTLPCDMLILDEACAAWETDMVDRNLLRCAISERPADREVILTGRTPAEWMHTAADYSTEMCCCRHPYAQGVPARKGVEF